MEVFKQKYSLIQKELNLNLTESLFIREIL